MLLDILMIVFAVLNIASFLLFLSVLRDKLQVVRAKRKLKQMTKTLSEGVAKVNMLQEQAVRQLAKTLVREAEENLKTGK